MAAVKDRLIILSGVAGAGKDSVADILVDQHRYQKFSLSHEMKVFCQRVFGWSDDQLWGPSKFRNAPDLKWARPCKHCKSTGIQIDEFRRLDERRLLDEECCDACEGTGNINDNSPRRVLQLLGDEWARQMIHPDIWTLSAFPRIEKMLSSGHNIVINDARFANDRRNLASWFSGTRVDVRTARQGDKAIQDWHLHASELSRPQDDEVEFIIHNDEQWPFPGLRARVEAMLAELRDG